MKIFPPRPENAISPSLIKRYESKNWIAQLKKNGTCTTIVTDKEGKPQFYTRECKLHKAWTPTPPIVSYFSQFPDSVFIGELLHNKHPSVKDTIYLFDIVRYHGLDLVGQTLEKRLNLMKSILDETEFVWLAKTYKHNLRDLFKSLNDPIDEGLVLKNPFAVLKDCHRKSNNSGWQVKCRVPTKNYGF